MKDKTGLVIVTGAGGGLGRALSSEFAKAGWLVFGIGLHSVSLQETGKIVGSDCFRHHVADVADADAVRTAFKAADELQIPVRILVNNAAIYEAFDILERPPEAYMRTLAVNTGGMINCAHAALTRMVKDGRGRLINVISFADVAPLPSSGAYSVSKGAGRIFTRALVADLADRFPEITVTDWAPGVLATDMGIPDGIDPAVAAKWGVALALDFSKSLNGCTFERNGEVLPPRSLRTRVKALVTLQPAPRPRILSDS